MAKEIYARLGRPSTALIILCTCLLAPVGWMAFVGANDDAASTPSALPAPAPATVDDGGAGSLASAVVPMISSAGVPASIKTPSFLDPPATLPIAVGSNWRYFKGTSAPTAGWNTVGYDDTTWLQGPSGIGYGDSDDATTLSDMLNGYVSVYIRREFTIPNLGAISGLVFTVDYDDGFVVYVNGVERGRSATMTGTGTPPPNTALATASHEALAGGGGPAESITITPAQLVQGTNVIAIQGHNATIDSTDFSLIPSLAVVNSPPAAPAGPSPASGQTNVPLNPQLCVTVDDPEGTPLDVTFQGREASGAAGDPFTIIALPDTQYYAASFPATFTSQLQWILNNRVSRKIAFVTELGDCVDDGGIQAQWNNANAAFTLIENPLATMLPDGMPYGIAVGNHDQSPIGTARTGADENVTTTLYNAMFGKSRFLGRGYFGDNYPLPGLATSMDNHYELFSAGGMDFIIFHLEWDDTTCSWPSSGAPPTPPLNTCQSVLTWMRDLLTGTYSNRRAIVVTHFMGTPSGGGTGTPALSTQGQAIINCIKPLPNVFMTMGGHLDQADRRIDLANDSHEIHTLISDYQTRPNGGNGWLRIMTFDPQADTIHVETYSPTLDRFINKLNDGTPNSHADNLAPTENEFTISYDMDSGTPFTTIGSDNGTPAGTQACVSWPGRQSGTMYEWRATASDGAAAAASPVHTFTTTSSCTVSSECDDSNACTDDVCNNSLCENTPIAGCCLTAGDCNDADACTDDVCNGGSCENPSNAGSCDDDNNCTVDSCVPATGCDYAYTPAPGCCATSADCDDGLATTVDTCSSGDCSNDLSQSCSAVADCNDNNACTTDACTGNASALSFDGVNDYVTMGAAPGLNASVYTIETWFRRTGTGVANQTGTSGIAALVPLVTKGAPEADGSNLDADYILGINTAGNFLAADFEDAATGLNHPISGTTAISNNVWYHAAATYDGTTWRLYLNGNLEASLTVGAFSPRSDTIQHAGIGTMLTSSGGPLGFFQGQMDEVRIWNIVRTQAEIAADMSHELTAATGLVGRWGLNENTGTTAADSATPSENGTLTGGPTWSSATKAPVGLCSWTPIPGCTPCTTAADCNDSNLCTTDTCNSGVCSNAAVTCSDDGNVCNGPEACSSATGLCASGPAATNGSSCADADLCDGAETCQAGVCAPGTALTCDDSNGCTDNACVPATGCQYTNNSAPCAEDGNPCTDDVCSGGSCAHPNDNTNFCTDANGCTGNACLSGSCVAWYAPTTSCCDATGDCNDGLGATTDTCVGPPDGSCSNVVSGSCTTAAQCNDSNGCTTDACVGAVSGPALSFDGTNDYVTMGAAAGTSALGATTFTLEAWVYWTGGGATTATGGTSGLLSAIPIIAKGRGEADGSNVDINYFLGLSGGKLAADFEQLGITSGTGQNVPGLNRAICGSTALSTNTWNHVAAVYDGCWKLYLNGVAESLNNSCINPTSPVDWEICPLHSATAGGTDNSVSAVPRSDSIQHFGIGTAMTSTGAAAGFFQGRIDEPRVWNVGRTQSEIQTGMSQEITSATGLIGRWGLNEGTGTTTADSTVPAQNGTLTNGPTWTTDSPVGSTPGSCTNTPIPSCSPCGADYQCSDFNTCTTDSCITTNDAAVSLPSPGAIGNRVDLALGTGSNASPDYINYFGTSSFTIEGWVYTDGGTAASTGIFRHGRQGAFPQIVVQLTGTGNLQLAGSVESNAAGQVDVTAPVALVASTWNHFALVVDRAAQQVRLHVNGGAPTSVATAWGANPISSTDQSMLGAARDTGGAVTLPYDGRLDEIRIWSFARTQAQIAADMSREITSAPGLVHRWGFNEGSLTSAADSVGGITGTLLGAATWSTTNLPFAGSDTCTHSNLAGGTACSDENACTSGETCNGSAVCGGGSTVTCDDVNVCTTDSCNAATGCDYAPITGGGTTTCGTGSCEVTVTNCVGGVAQTCTPGTPVTEVCDGIDNDCDGAADDGNPGSGALCGTDVGECVAGTTQCTGGTLTCQGGVGPAAEICDGLDNDCDGVVDNGNPGGGVQCGSDVGECTSGLTQCTGGVIDCSGDVGSVAEVCDGLDNDCDGSIDNGNPGGGVQCGSDVGECTSGLTQCTGGVINCSGDVGSVAELCDGLDNDCDGSIDNGNPGGGVQCGSDVGECTSGLTQCTGGVIDCSGDVGSVAELCDGLDNDCDGSIDNGNPGGGAQCGSDVGECTSGLTQCTGGVIDCSGDVGSVAEVCDGLDNDCDGTTDNGNPGGGAQCGSDVGECTSGLTQCTNGAIDCTGDVGPTAEVCDNTDNDCDGTVDEGNPGGGLQCGSDVGECTSGLTQCTGGVIDCSGDVGSVAEVCDGLDNDCDGTTDNGNPGGGLQCGSDVGECTSGLTQCTNGAIDCAGDVGPTAEVCDNTDNDCDGTIDEGNPGGGLQCGSDVGECTSGLTQCTNGAIDCTGDVGPTAEVCDNTDNDCDGTVDEGNPGGGLQCGTDVGECTSGLTQCTGGVIDCTGDVGSVGEVCDGLDNDCDGTIDDGNPGGGATCGTDVGECTSGLTQCTGGVIDCTGDVGSVGEVCDGLDNDCDGTIDDGNPGGGATCGTDVGECTSGLTQCTGGTIDCAGDVGPGTEVCDNLDNDCDGTIDDGNPGGGATCGTDVGECTSGLTQCTGGAIDCTGDVGPGTEVCDNLDNDCDGTIDDGNPGGGAQCGSDVGECTSGLTQCTGGAIDCTGDVGPGTEVCDNLDNDCDGTIDDGNPGGGAQCGSDVGECTSGLTQCTGGVIDCTGDVGPGTEVCDNLDNDCDGTIDDGNPGGGAQCGSDVGECTSGLTQCTGGVIDCTGDVGPGTEVCDNLDNDCDGTIDDGNPGGGATCGTDVGECTSGLTQCTGGAIDCTGDVGPGTEVCDNLDNDCDGGIDDGAGATCDDGNICNGAETCGAGSCQAGAPLVCNDGDLCTADSCNPASGCVYTPVACTADISGALIYYRDANAVAEPSSRGVAGVSVHLTGTGSGVPDQATTGSSGAYAFTGKLMGESYTVSPRKSGDFSGAITSFDAALVARKVVNLISLTANQQLAGDTTGNGGLSSLDASYIARVAAGLDPQTPVGITVGDDWFMVPSPAPAPNQIVTNPAIPPGSNGSISYGPLAAPASSQSFLAGLFGDVSGNWANIAPFANRPGGGMDAIRALAARRPGPAARLVVSQASAVKGGLVEVTIRVEDAEQALSFDLDLGYDPQVLVPEGVRAGAAAASFTVTPNTTTRGRVRISLFSPEPLGASGDLVVLRFRMLPGARRGSSVSLTGFVDEGSVRVSFTNGSIKLRKGQ